MSRNWFWRGLNPGPSRVVNDAGNLTNSSTEHVCELGSTSDTCSMQKIYQLWAVFKAKNGHEWTELTFRTSLWSSIHHVRAVAYRFSAVFPRSTISGKAGREFWRNLDVKLCLQRYFYTCTLDLYPKISALEEDMGQIIWFIHGFAPLFRTFWPHFGSLCSPEKKVFWILPIILLLSLARRVLTLKLFSPYDFDLYTTRSILKYTIMASHKWSAASKGDFPIKSQMDLISLHFEGQMAGCRYFRSKRVVCLTFGRCHTWNGVWALSS